MTGGGTGVFSGKIRRRGVGPSPVGGFPLTRSVGLNLAEYCKGEGWRKGDPRANLTSRTGKKLIGLGQTQSGEIREKKAKKTDSGNRKKLTGGRGRQVREMGTGQKFKTYLLELSWLEAWGR